MDLYVSVKPANKAKTKERHGTKVCNGNKEEKKKVCNVNTEMLGQGARRKRRADVWENFTFDLKENKTTCK